MFEKAAVILIHCETPLHPGSGTNLSAIDLPIQREKSTQLPMVQGSGVKGVLRDLAEDISGPDDAMVRWVFGPRPKAGESPEHAGYLSLTDARLLLFPVASLRGIFAWVTCPYVLERFRRDLQHLNGAIGAVPDVRLSLKDEDALVTANSEVALDNGQLVLEEFAFRADLADEHRKAVGTLSEWLAHHLFPDDTSKYWNVALQKRLVIVSDNIFRDFASHAVEVVTRIQIQPDSKTVGQGPWQEEALPAESVLYSIALAASPRRTGRSTPTDTVPDADAVLSFLHSRVLQEGTGVSQMGGDETVGRGLVRFRLFPDLGKKKE